MASTQEFRKRIRSVNNTRQITRAMEMVASVKMQKAVATILQTRSYIQTTWNLLELIKTKKDSDFKHPFLRNKPTGKTALVIISSDRGLCGSLNSDVYKKTQTFVDDKKNEDIDVIAIGKYSIKIAMKLNLNIVAQFSGFENNVEYEDTTSISKLLMDEYLNKKYGKIVLIYSHFISSLIQLPVTKQLLPVEIEHIDQSEIWEKKVPEFWQVEYVFEPNLERLINQALPQFLRTQVYGAILESNASEQSSRMLAMKNATDNAGDIISDLTLAYNTIRQDNITREIAEICAGAEAMS